MELVVVFVIFSAGMAVSLLLGISMLVPLVIGFVLFTVLARRRGFSLKQVLGFAAGSLKESFIVVGILLLIGCLTGTWRLSGTVAYFVSLGVSLIPPAFFLPSAFLLSALMSYALGTSFGVTATAGVILMSIARAGGVDPVLAAGAIFSGVYVGDRGSPAASSANLVAVVTHTDMRENVRAMLRCSVVPFLLTLALYTALSPLFPMREADSPVSAALAEQFTLTWPCILPAVIMLVLPFCGLKIKLSMALSLVSSVAVAMLVQHASIIDCLLTMLSGYAAPSGSLSETLSGGGIVSMLEICGILIISCSFGSIFENTGLLAPVTDAVGRLARRCGRFAAMLLLAVGVSALFCNQTIGIIMQNDLSAGLYGKDEGHAKMLDTENSVILIAGLVPWCIASSVPRAMLGVGSGAILSGFYLWFVPIWWYFRTCKRKKPVVK